MKSRIGVSIAIAGILIIGLVDWVVADWFGLPKTVTPLGREIDSLPLQLGDWSGEPTERDPVLDEAVGADSIVNRRYTHPNGASITVHVAVWSRYDGLVHPPQECHRGAGYDIRAEEDLPFDNAESTPGSGRVLRLTRNGNELHVLYWYQLGDVVIRDHYGLKAAHRQLCGKPSRPQLVKVMLSCGGRGKRVTEDLAELSGKILDWLGR